MSLRLVSSLLMFRYASHTPTGAMGTVNQHLRGMLMAHLDIIQQQAETILSKDKMLRALREETSLLRQKLERMTRRLKPGEEVREPRGKKRSLESTEEELRGCKKIALPLLVAEEPRTPPRVERRPVAPGDELRDEFCNQTSPEVSEQLEVRSRVPESCEEEIKPPPDKTVARGRKGRSLGSEEGGGRGRASTGSQPPGPAAGPSPLTSSDLYYVGCRNDREVEIKVLESNHEPVTGDKCGGQADGGALLTARGGGEASLAVPVDCSLASNACLVWVSRTAPLSTSVAPLGWLPPLTLGSRCPLGGRTSTTMPCLSQTKSALKSRKIKRYFCVSRFSRNPPRSPDPDMADQVDEPPVHEAA